MKSKIDYRIKAQIKGEHPDIQFEVIYVDDFSNDHYILKSSESPESNINYIPFVVYKNGKQIDQISLVDKNIKKFFEEFVSLTEDDDFSKKFNREVLEKGILDIKNFFDFFEDSIILKGITLEGEKRRMKKVAGILKENT